MRRKIKDKVEITLLILFPMLLIGSCFFGGGEKVETKYLITNKRAEQVYDNSKSNIFKTVYKTEYYLVLKGYGTEMVSFSEYCEYEIGDYYTIVEYI